MNKKIWIGLIIFILILIPFFFILKRLIAFDYQKESIGLFYQSSGNFKANQMKAMEKIDLAIWLAPRSYLLYTTKSQMLFELGNYQLAIDELIKIEGFKDAYAEGFTGQGIIYDVMNKSDSAVIQYNKALECYNFRIAKSKINSFELKSAEINRLFIYYLLQDSSTAFAEYRKLQNSYPEEPTMELFKDFNKENYIGSLIK